MKLYGECALEHQKELWLEKLLLMKVLLIKTGCPIKRSNIHVAFLSMMTLVRKSFNLHKTEMSCSSVTSKGSSTWANKILLTFSSNYLPVQIYCDITERCRISHYRPQQGSVMTFLLGFGGWYGAVAYFLRKLRCRQKLHQIYENPTGFSKLIETVRRMS